MEKQCFWELIEEKNNTAVLIKLYRKGRLGGFPDAENRLKAGLIFMNDYRRSVFSQRVTGNYDGLHIVGGAKNEYSSLRCDAADRYLKALKSIKPYGVYALHFLRDDGNVRSFLDKYPVLNQGRHRTYDMVYRAICRMLDGLVAFYDGNNAQKKI